MRDSLMLSSLTMGEKQHPRLGGCVRVFFQLFDWNRRLACKKRIFSQKQLPSERHIRRAFIKTYKDASGEMSVSNADGDQVFFITNGEEEDNLQVKLESCSKEEIIGGEVMRERNDVVHEAVAASAGFSSENESIQESPLLVKSPGVIGKLMGLDSLPSPCTPPPCEIKPKGSPPHSPAVDPPPLFSSTVIPPPDLHHYMPKVDNLAFQHGLPDEELNALLSELNGNMCSILSALPPHIGISSRNCPSTSATPQTPLTTRRSSTMGVSSSCLCPVQTNMNATSGPGASSPSYATLTQIHDVKSTCPATTIQTYDVNLATGPAYDFPTQTTMNTTSAVSNSITFAPNAYEERDSEPHHMEGAQSREDQRMCARDDLSQLEQQSMKCPRRAGEGGGRGSIKRGKRMKAKGPSSGGSGKRLSQKSVSASIYGASMAMNVPCSPQELQDVGRTTCKPVRRKKVDTSMQQRLQEGDIKGSPSYIQSMQYRPLEESSCLRGSPIINQAVIPHRKREDALGVRDSPNDQASCSLASRHAASTIICKHDDCLPSSNFAIQYNVGFFDEYHKSKGKLPSASKCKHTDDSGIEKAHKSKGIREAVADPDHRSASLHSGNAAIKSSAGTIAKEDPSFISVLIKRRVAREAAATAAMEAAGILQTASPPAEALDLPAITSRSVESLQSMISSCSTNQLGNDPNRREKLSAGRSEAGGGDFIQVLRPIGECSTAAGAACCVSGNRNCEGGGMQEGGRGDRDDGSLGWCGKLGMGNGAEGFHRGMCMVSSKSMACTKESAGGGGVQVEICGTSHAGSGKNTTAAMLQDVISALNGSAQCTTPVRTLCRRRHHHHHRHLFSDDDGSSPSAADGNDTESTSESGSCWAAASQPSPVSVLIPPFDDDVSPAGDEGCWIQSEDDYVAALLAATSENGKTNLPPAELFGKLEERVIAAWPDSEVPPTRSYRRLVFDCVCEALGQAVAIKECRGNRWGKARVLFEEMCRWRQGGSEIVLDDLVEAELRKACNGWVAFEAQTREIAGRLERTICGLLVEELVCDLVLSL